MTTTTSYFLRPVAALVALVAAMAALLLAYSASPVHATASCSTTAGTTTCTFSPTGSEDTFLVPEGVSAVHVVATGAPGAVGLSGGTAGRGAEVSADLTVTPGDTLYVNVGGAPTELVGTCFSGIACIGGFNGGGSSAFGGGGGGASDVRTVSRALDGSLGSRLIVAGGGGGSGLGTFCILSDLTLSGGSGGDAGSDGGDGQSCATVSGGTGGQAGTESAGGAGGSPLGQNGSLGLGGNGGRDTGGGGGGGLYGGGGGGATNADVVDGTRVVAPAGGGGGGSNLVPAGGTATIATTTGPSITISYTLPKPTPTTKEQCKKGGWKEFGYPDQGTCISDVNRRNR